MAGKRENSRDENSNDISKKNQKQKSENASITARALRDQLAKSMSDGAIKARDEAAKEFANISRNTSKKVAEQNREYIKIFSESRKFASQDIFATKIKGLDIIKDITHAHKPPINHRSIPLHPSVQMQRNREERELEEKRMNYQQFLKDMRDNIFDKWIHNDKFKDELAKQYGIVHDLHESFLKAYNAGKKKLPDNLYHWYVPDHSDKLTETQMRIRDYAMLAIVHDGYNWDHGDHSRYIRKDLRKKGKIIDPWWGFVSSTSRCQGLIEEAWLFVEKDIKEPIQETKDQRGIGLKTVHKALIKALSNTLNAAIATEITRDTLVRKTNYSVGTGTVNKAYANLKKWGIITEDGQNFTADYQHYKENPPD